MRVGWFGGEWEGCEWIGGCLVVFWGGAVFILFLSQGLI